MKKHLSVLMLAARSTIYRVLGLLAVMSGVQIALFVTAMNRHPEYRLTELLDDCPLALVYGAGFWLLCILLSLSGAGLGGSKSVYTLRRLSVGEGTVVFWWAVYNGFAFLLFWLWEALLVLGLCLFYTTQAGEGMVGPQTVFLACYRDRFLHSLLPLAEVSRYIRNIALVISLAVTSSCFAFHLRSGRKGIAMVIQAGITTAIFCAQMGNLPSDVMACVFSVLTAGIAAAIVRGRLGDEENKL